MPAGTVDCSDAVLNATTTWLQLGGRRIDSGDSYNNCRVMGAAMKESGVDRKDIFLVSKIGSGLPMGVRETDQQVAWMLKAYVTLRQQLRCHSTWPFNFFPLGRPCPSEHA